jgi:hypothetical protein
MARIEESDGGQRHSSGDQLGKRTKSLDQLIKELDPLMENTLIDGFKGKDRQGIKEDYNQIKQEAQDSYPGMSRRQDRLRRYEKSVSELAQFHKDLMKHIGKRPEIDGQSDKTQADNPNGVVNEVRIGIPSEDAHESSLTGTIFGDCGFASIARLFGYKKDELQQPLISNKGEHIELTNMTISKEDIEKLHYQLEKSCVKDFKRFTDSNLELNYFVYRVESSIKSALYAYDRINEFSGDWQTVVSYYGNIIANSPDSSERGSIDKDSLVQNVLARIAQAWQSLDDIKTKLQKGDINVLESSRILRWHHARLSEIWVAMREIDPKPLPPMQNLPYIQKMLMGCCGTPKHELWGEPKEPTAEQKMEEQRIRGLVNIRLMVYSMVDMCKRNISEIASYWHSNFDRIHQSASVDTNQIFGQINHTKAYIEKVENVMEKTKLENEKDLSQRLRKDYTMSYLLQITDEMSENNQQLSNIWTNLQELSSDNLLAHLSARDIPE